MLKINFFLSILSGLVKKLWYSVVLKGGDIHAEETTQR